jgi:hypothetical protein
MGLPVRVVTESNGEYSIRSPMQGMTIEEARARAQEDQPHVRIVTDAEEIAHLLELSWEDRKRLDTELRALRDAVEEMQRRYEAIIRDLESRLARQV